MAMEEMVVRVVGASWLGRDGGSASLPVEIGSNGAVADRGSLEQLCNVARAWCISWISIGGRCSTVVGWCCGCSVGFFSVARRPQWLSNGWFVARKGCSVLLWLRLVRSWYCGSWLSDGLQIRAMADDGAGDVVFVVLLDGCW